jgi:ComEC/Rec2-related protein
MKRPLGIVAALYAGGLLLGDYFQPPLPCLFATALAFAAAALLFPRFRSLLIWPLIVFTGWTNVVWHTAVVSPDDLRVLLTNRPELTFIRGTLASTPTERVYINDNDDGKIYVRTMARVDVTNIQRGTNWVPATGRIAVITPDELPEAYFGGRKVEIYGVLSPPPGPIAEGLFDFPTFLRRQEIYFQLKTRSAADWQIADTKKISPPFSDRFSKWAKTALALGTTNNNESLRLEEAITLGDKTFLTDDVTEPFIRASTYHIFAVDGLRMAIIFTIFFTSFRALRMPRTFSGLVLIPLIWFYVALTGWPASAIRAAVMLTIVIAGWMLRRPGNVLNSLFAAALIILLCQPQQLFQPGFQLSFFVVLCILLVMPMFEDFIKRLLKPDPLLPEELRPRWQRVLDVPARWILGLSFTSLAAWLGSIPLVAYYFHILTPVSTPANIVAIPLCMLVLSSNLISLLFAAWFPAGSAFFNHVGSFFMDWIRGTSHWFANWPLAYAYVPAPTLFAIIVYYAILLALLTGWLFKPNWRPWKIAALTLLLTIWGARCLYQRSTTRLTVLPLNGGSAIYCDSPGNNLLIDCGNENAARLLLTPYLRAQGVNSLPSLILTCGETRQVGGFALLQSLVPVAKVITSSARFRSAAYRSIIQSLEATAGRRQVVNAGDTFGVWTALSPTDTDQGSGTGVLARADDNALVLRGEFQGIRVLLLSSLGKAGQDALLKRNPDLRADIVIAGLPTQGEPLGNALLDAIHPKLIIIADSDLPVMRRASPALQARLGQRHISTLYTRNVGAVTITMRKSQWEVTP